MSLLASSCHHPGSTFAKASASCARVKGFWTNRAAPIFTASTA